jgi:microcompartment protein CcmK/EutM
MQFAEAIGNTVATQKTGRLQGLHLIVVRFLDYNLEPTGKTAVAIDTVGCRPHDLVLVCGSSSARMTAKTRDRCTDLSIVGIVDSVTSGKKEQIGK